MASGPYSAPWSDTGRLQGDIDRLSSQVNQKAGSYEVSSLNSKVDGLELTVGELSSSLDGLRSELSQLRENFREALNVLSQITTVL